jgi:hypothetical protein
MIVVVRGHVVVIEQWRGMHCCCGCGHCPLSGGHAWLSVYVVSVVVIIVILALEGVCIVVVVIVTVAAVSCLCPGHGRCSLQ